LLYYFSWLPAAASAAAISAPEVTIRFDSALSGFISLSAGNIAHFDVSSTRANAPATPSQLPAAYISSLAAS
jgi:hypothetical protein